jgi:hypothetical protein
MRQVLGWTEKDEEGNKRDVEAARSLNQWTFRYRYNRMEEWVPVPNPPLAYWEELVDLLERKYHRRRCAWHDVEDAQAFLAKAREKA